MKKKAESIETIEEDSTIDIKLEEEHSLNDHAEEDNSESQVVQDNSNESEKNGDDNEIIVSIGEESPTSEEDKEPAPEWVRKLRKDHRELQRQKRELEEKLKQQHAETKPATLGKKPTLEDHDYDADAFEQALTQWYEQKRKIDEIEAKEKEEAENQHKAWRAKLDSYSKAKAELKVKDFEDAEESVQEYLSVTQQGIVLQGSENPALLVYALGKNHQKAKELSSINDPVKFAFAVAKLEAQLKVTQRKSAPPPEKTVSGTGKVSGAVDSTLERLRAEADKTGDYSKVMQYKQQKRRSM